MKKKTKNTDKNRRYDAYFAKMANKMKMSTTKEVNQELDKMLRFVISEFGCTANVILKNYVKKDTVKPNMAYTTLNSMLCGDLRNRVTEAGSHALVEHLKKSESSDATAAATTAPPPLNEKTVEGDDD